MAWTNVSTGDTIEADHINDIHGALDGTVGKGQVMSFTDVEDTAHYALSVRNKDTTNSLIARFLNAAGTAVMSVVKEAINITKPLVSTVADGTAPFTITSTTKVDNLHVETAAAVDADAIDGDAIAAGAVDSEHIAAGAVDLEHMSANSVDSDQYVDGSIDTAHLANDAVDDTKVGNRVPQFYRRMGGSATDWATAGGTTYTPTTVRMQGGTYEYEVSSGSAGVSLGFPVAFSYTPLVYAQVEAVTSDSARYMFMLTSVSKTAFQGWIRADDESSTHDGTVNLYWLAIGPE